MSGSCDDTYDVYDETERKARKDHRCSACQEKISAGQRYTVIKVVYDHSAQTIKRCARCQKIHEHLRERCESRNNKTFPSEHLWPAELLDCGESYEGEWGKCPPEIQALAFELPEDQ